MSLKMTSEVPTASNAPTATATPAAPAAAAPIPEVSSMGGAQGVRPAPAGTIPAPLKAFSDRPESAKSKMMERLKAKSKPPVEAEAPAKAKAPEAKQPESVPTTASEDDLMGEDETGNSTLEPEAKTEEAAKEGEQATAQTKQKVNPWKLAEERKAKLQEMEKQLNELKTKVPNEDARKQELAEVETLRKRAKELEEHIRFVDYQASDEYKERYEKPYEQQWVKSMKELKGVTVVDDNGEPREIEPSDMLQLVNMPLAKARQVANEVFGDFSDDVMRHRDSIRALFDDRTEALSKARKEGVEKSQSMQVQNTQRMEAIRGEVKSAYDKAVETVIARPELAEIFKPAEGNEEHKVALDKGYAMVDEAFNLNPMDPNLTAEQRASIVKKHAAVRHKAAAYSVLRQMLKRERAEKAEALKKLQAFESTVPNRGGSQPQSGSMPQGGSAMDRMRARLRQRGHAVTSSS